VIDDAQWLDTESADALLFTARRLQSEGIVLLLASRATGTPAFPRAGCPTSACPARPAPPRRRCWPAPARNWPREPRTP